MSDGEESEDADDDSQDRPSFDGQLIMDSDDSSDDSDNE